LPLIFMFTGVASIIIMPMVGKLSDKFDKFKIFTAGSILAVIMVIIYTHLSVVPMWEVVVINMILFMGIMSRIIPATALNTSIPTMQDRGAFMSIMSSLQQMAGGLGAMIAGLVVHQATKTSPIENFDTLGFVVSGVILICIFLIYRVNAMVKVKEN
jgi:predicted MFS family arabinose efflux permease